MKVKLVSFSPPKLIKRLGNGEQKLLKKVGNITVAFGEDWCERFLVMSHRKIVWAIIPDNKHGSTLAISVFIVFAAPISN